MFDFSPTVQKFVDQATRQTEAAAAARQKIAEDGLPLFEANVPIWLGSLMHEITEMSEPIFLFDNNGTIFFQLTFLWNGAEGMVRSGPWGLSWKRICHGSTWLMFNTLRPSLLDDHEMRLRSHLPEFGNGEYCEQAIATDETVLGKFMLGIIKAIDQTKADIKARHERAERDVLDQLEKGFEQCEDIHAVQKYLAEIMVQAAEDTPRWSAAARRRTLELTRLAQEKKAAEERASMVFTEEALMREDGKKLFHPFTIYELEVATNDPAVNRTVYTTTAVPDEAGWYGRIIGGKINPYRPGYIISVTQHDIDSQDDPLLSQFCEWVTLQSDKIDSLIITVFKTPDGL